jgi:ABC-type sugar transport system ATPase subunit
MGEIAAAGRVAVGMMEISKSFGATRALKAVNLQVAEGTVHALIGENGAGKSTALGILAGRIAPTSGRVEIFGAEPRYGNPRAARRAGVVAIYQELTIVPALSAEANVFLGDPLHRLGFLSERTMRKRYEALCERIGVQAVPPRTPAKLLSVADQQMLEIIRAVRGDAQIILFDEPTASLAVAEREALFALIKSLRASGTTIMFVSHNLDEVLELSDTITVFRDGGLRVTAPRGEFDKARLVREMLGDAADDRLASELLESHDGAEAPAHPVHPVRRRPRDRALLKAEGVTVPGAIEDVDIEIREGEVVGIGGLVGSGRSTLLRALAGLEPSAKGRLWIDGREVSWPHSVRKALGYGIALIPEDRKTQGLALPMSAMDNIAVSDFAAASRWRFISPRMVERSTEDVAGHYGVRQDRLRTPARHLSGGNQQKLMLARWQYRTPHVLLADEPTRGIDVGAKAEILHSLEAMADAGLGLVIASSELEEVAAVADRVVVLAEGRVSGYLERDGDELISTAEILHLAFQVRSATEPAIAGGSGAVQERSDDE